MKYPIYEININVASGKPSLVQVYRRRRNRLYEKISLASLRRAQRAQLRLLEG